MTKKLCIISAALIATSSSFAAIPTPKEIIASLTNLNESHANPKTAIHIKETKAIKLKSGEIAYISGVDFDNAGRNFWGGYILTRPKLKQSKILDYGGQANEFKIYQAQPKTKPIYLIQLSISGSGQGSMSNRDDLVYFEGWEPYVVATAESSSDPGRYNDRLGEEDCKTGEIVDSTLKVMVQENYVLRTTKKSNACKDTKVTVKVDKLPFNIQ